MQRANTFQLDYATLWQSITYMETYLRQRKKTRFSSASTIKELTEPPDDKRPATHPNVSVRRPRFSNIEKMMEKPDVAIDILDKDKESPLRISRENSAVGGLPNYDLPRLRPVHVEAREIPLPTHIKEMRLFSFVGDPMASRQSIFKQPSRLTNYDDDEEKYLPHTKCITKLPEIHFPTTNYDACPSTRELSIHKEGKEMRCSWISASTRCYSNKGNIKKGKGLHRKGAENSLQKTSYKEPHSLKLTTRADASRIKGINGVLTETFYAGDVLVQQNSKETLKIVAKQEPLHLSIKSK